jgi:hypothetical protein
MRFAGLNITYPCKQLVLLDAVSDRRRPSGRQHQVRTDDHWSGETPTVGWKTASAARCRGRTSCVTCWARAERGSAWRTRCCDSRGAAPHLDRDAPRAVALAAD